jgi:hypothetical protein
MGVTAINAVPLNFFKFRRVPSPELAKALKEGGVKPSAVEKAERRLRQLGRTRAKQLYRWQLEADLALKGGRSSGNSQRLVLEEFIVCLSRQFATPAASSEPWRSSPGFGEQCQLGSGRRGIRSDNVCDSGLEKQGFSKNIVTQVSRRKAATARSAQDQNLRCHFSMHIPSPINATPAKTFPIQVFW